MVDTIHPGNIDSLLVSNIEPFTQSYKLMDALTRLLARCKARNHPVTAHVKRYKNKAEIELYMVQRFRQQILETTCQPLLATLKVDAE